MKTKLPFSDLQIAKPVTVETVITDHGPDAVTGLRIKITPSGTRTFGVRLPVTQKYVDLGPWVAGKFEVLQARIKARAYRDGAKLGLDVVQERADEVSQIEKGAVTFNQLADAWLDYIKQPIPKKGFSKPTPRKESWVNDRQQLKVARELFGELPARAIKRSHILAVIASYDKRGKFAYSNAVRSTLVQLFKWASSPEGKGGGYLEDTPCGNLGPIHELPVDEENFLANEQIKKLWWALDRVAEYPRGFDRRHALALKLILCTGLRPGEIVNAKRSWLKDLTSEQPYYRVPLDRVKNRNDTIQQPLNSLAIECINELLALPCKPGETQLFPSGRGIGVKITTRRLSTALVGDRVRKHPGLLAWLGWSDDEAFTPHTLRHTAATLLGEANVSNKEIGLILDHTTEDGVKVTRRYNHAEVREPRRPILEQLDALLRGVIGKPPASNVVSIRRIAA